MGIGGQELDVPGAVLVALAVAVLGALVVGGATSAAAFGAYNPAWEGTSDVRTVADEVGAGVVVAGNVSAYDGRGNGTVAVVLAPTEPYTEAEADRIAAFLERGGTLLVADRDGTGNGLLAALGAETRTDGAPLRDERNHYRGPALPEATTVSEHELTEGVDALTLNHGTALEPGGATVLVSSSSFGYLDRNRNGELDDVESLGAYPVAATEPVGEGRVVVVSDPSAFINVMADRPGNRRFLANLFSGGETVLIDTSHGGELPPLVAAVLAIRGSAPLQLLLAGAGLVVLAAWQRREPRGGREFPSGNPSADALAATAAERYPSLERDRVRELIEGIKTVTRKRRDDE